MTSDARVADVVTELEAAGVSCLVMGGHAVRFYGLARSTLDVDLNVAPGPWEDLPKLLAQTKLFESQALVEGPTWRPDAFRRFRLGTLPDGRDEWLEFWRENHLLAPHDELRARAERGLYGGRMISFVGLEDLIRAKETERDADWQDIAVLEQFLDARWLAQARSHRASAADALRCLRSQAGFLGYLDAGYLTREHAAEALRCTSNPVTQSFLIPFAPDAPVAACLAPVEPLVLQRLRATAPAEPLHLALAEVVRRRYIAFRKELDRRDKDAIVRGRLGAR